MRDIGIDVNPLLQSGMEMKTAHFMEACAYEDKSYEGTVSKVGMTKDDYIGEKQCKIHAKV